MNLFQNFRVHFWLSTDSSGEITNMLSLHADLPKDPALVRESCGYEHYDGISRIFFVMTEDEVKKWIRDSFNLQIADVSHRMDCCGDQCLFYDSVGSQGLREKYGTVQVGYYAASIPLFFRKMLYRIAKRVWKDQTAQYHALPKDDRWKVGKKEISFTPEFCQRIERLYGQGKGRVIVDYGYRESETRLGVEQALSSPEFKKRLDHVMVIARNSTRGFHQTASVSLSIDAQDRETGRIYSFYWLAKNTKGRTIMNGCVMDHSHSRPGDDPSWSIHT